MRGCGGRSVGGRYSKKQLKPYLGKVSAVFHFCCYTKCAPGLTLVSFGAHLVTQKCSWAYLRKLWSTFGIAKKKKKLLKPYTGKV